MAMGEALPLRTPVNMMRFKLSLRNMRGDAHRPVTDLRLHDARPAYYAKIAAQGSTPMWRKVSRAIFTAGAETAKGYKAMLTKNLSMRNVGSRLAAVGIYLGLGFLPAIPDATLRSLAKQADPSITMPGDSSAMNPEVLRRLAAPAFKMGDPQGRPVAVSFAGYTAQGQAHAAAVSPFVPQKPPWHASADAREGRRFSLERHHAIAANSRQGGGDFKSLAQLATMRRKR